MIAAQKLWQLVRSLLPLPCPWCGEGDGGGRNALCPECRKLLPFIDDGVPHCPGCGGTRAAVALLYGQIGHSLKCNPLTAYLAAGFLALDIRAAVGILRRQPFSLRIPLWYFWVMLAIAVVHCIVRNVLMITVGYDYLGDLVRFWHP